MFTTTATKTEKLHNNLCHYDLFSQIVCLKKAMTNEYYIACWQHHAVCMNNYAHFIFAGDINFPQKHCCATLSIFI